MKTRALLDGELDTLRIFCRRYPMARFLKYKPGKRCLCLVSLGNSEQFVKFYPRKFMRNGRGPGIHEVGRKLWDLSRSGTTGFRVPKPVRWEDETRSLWVERMEGVDLESVFVGINTTRIVSEIGEAVGVIGGLDISEARHFDREDQFGDTVEMVRKAEKAFPGKRLRFRNLLSLQRAFSRALPDEELVAAHGDMHPGQWLLCRDESPGLLDFEDFSLAEIERELAWFMVQLEAGFGDAVCVRTLEKAFIAGLKRAGRRPRKSLLRFYKSHKWLIKAAKANDEYVLERSLSNAYRCLGVGK